LKAFDQLLEIMKTLRDSEGGCPWDIKQTPKSLRPHMIEEVYEISEAITKDDAEALKEELGDLLLHIVFQARIAEEHGKFSIEDVIEKIITKMKRRHPHIFGKVKVENADEVEHNWEKIKKKEKEHRRSILEGLPKFLPALIKAKRTQSKAATVGFDWENIEDTFAKLKEELLEFEQEYFNKDKEKMKEEIGDLLFAMVNVARKLEIEPEFALEKTTKKFVKRFKYIEENLQENLFSSDLNEMEALWLKAKDEIDD